MQIYMYISKYIIYAHVYIKSKPTPTARTIVYNSCILYTYMVYIVMYNIIL